jgi:hypothetical protein
LEPSRQRFYERGTPVSRSNPPIPWHDGKNFEGLRDKQQTAHPAYAYGSPANEINTAIYEATDAVQKAFVSASDIHAILADSGKTPVWLDSNFIVTDPAFTDTYRFAEIPRGVSIQITHQNHSNSPNQQTKTTIAVLFGNIAKVDAPKFDSEKLRWGVRVTGRSAFTRSPVATPTNRSKTGAVPEVEVNFRFDDKTDAEACYRYLVHHRQ